MDGILSLQKENTIQFVENDVSETSSKDTNENIQNGIRHDRKDRSTFGSTVLAISPDVFKIGKDDWLEAHDNWNTVEVSNPVVVDYDRMKNSAIINKGIGIIDLDIILVCWNDKDEKEVNIDNIKNHDKISDKIIMMNITDQWFENYF